MIRFQEYLTEAAGKNLHLEHIEDEILGKIRSFSKKFDDSFKIHFELQEIQNVKKGIDENYQEFIKKKNEEI